MRASAGAPASPPVAAHVRASIQRTAQPVGAHRAMPQGGSARSDRAGEALLLPERFRFAPSRGQLLPAAVQQRMEAVFGADFSQVRVHLGPQAQQIGALAFTCGSDVYFAPGHYRPHDSHGRRLLGHELAHVMQQRAGRVHNPFGRGVAVVQDRAMEAEAERLGLQAALGRLPSGTSPQRAGARPAAGTGVARGPMPSRPSTAQPYIAKGTTVYYPSTTHFGPLHSRANFERSLMVLGSPPGTQLLAARATTWNDFATTQAGYQAKAMGGPTGGKNQKKVKRQFEDPTTVYHYAADANIQDVTPGHSLPLLSFADLAERSGPPLPVNVTHQDLAAAKCVIESLEDMGRHVPGTESGTVAEWHGHFRAQGLDYRQDNHYIVVYVRSLGFRLTSTAMQRFDQWNPPVGNYIVMTYNSADGAGVGHAIGVAVTEDEPGHKTKTIHDRQGLTDGWNPIYLKYVFQIP
jgi:Domain of unknown function (DUF4157)